jgi:DNA processing protein
MDEREALMWLFLCPGIRPETRRDLLRCGPAQQAVAALRKKKVGPTSQLMQKALQQPFLTCQDPEYPARLRHLDCPPEILFYRGNLTPLSSDQASVAVVGTRRATSPGRHLATRFGAALAQAGVRIISGMARGIDCAAHWASLECPDPYPVAVLACGLDVCYPSENLQLLRQIESQGIVFSEYPPGTPALAFHFQQRNRLLAALATAVLVVEAPARSGVMLTVDHALHLGRDVFVVPGALDHPNYEGNLNLIQEGALLARTPYDLLSQLPGAVRRDDFPMEAPARPEEWARRLGLELPETLRRLSLWERMGRMKRDSQGYFGWSGVGVPVAAGTGWRTGIGGRPLGSKGKFSN